MADEKKQETEIDWVKMTIAYGLGIATGAAGTVIAGSVTNSIRTPEERAAAIKAEELKAGTASK